MPITITSRFRPLTYDEITKPLIEQTNLQASMEDAYVTANTQANELLAQANQQTDPNAYARLKGYADELRNQADSLLRYGLSRSSRMSLNNMRMRYGNEIVPVQSAINRRKELIDTYQKQSLANPNLIWDKDPSTISLDSLISDPNIGNKAVDGDNVYKRASMIASAIGRLKTPQARAGKNLDRYTKQILIQSGLTEADIASISRNGDAGDSLLNKALTNIYNSTGVDSWDNVDAKNRVWQRIVEGAQTGVGEVQLQLGADNVAKRQDDVNDAYRQHRWNVEHEYRQRAWQKQDMDLELRLKGYVPDGKGSYKYVGAPGIGENGFVGYRNEDMQSVNGSKDIFVPKGDNVPRDENGEPLKFVRLKDNVYVPIKYLKDTEFPEDAKKWGNNNLGFIVGFDRNEDYGPNSLNKFNEIARDPRNRTSNKTFNHKVNYFHANDVDGMADLHSKNRKLYNKVNETIAKSGLDSSSFTVVYVQNDGAKDDDAFVIYNGVFHSYLQDVGIDPEYLENAGLDGSSTGTKSQSSYTGPTMPYIPGVNYSF